MWTATACLLSGEKQLQALRCTSELAPINAPDFVPFPGGTPFLRGMAEIPCRFAPVRCIRLETKMSSAELVVWRETIPLILSHQT